jgi:hypothetical protein
MAAKSTATPAVAGSAAFTGRLATGVGSKMESGAETAEGGGLLSASATTLAVPEVCRKSEVNSDRYAICRCCLADHGGETRDMAATNGL